jgi:hypothetical protein
MALRTARRPSSGMKAIIEVIKGEGLAVSKKIQLTGFAIGVDAYGTVKKSAKDVWERFSYATLEC